MSVRMSTPECVNLKKVWLSIPLLRHLWGEIVIHDMIDPLHMISQTPSHDIIDPLNRGHLSLMFWAKTKRGGAQSVSDWTETTIRCRRCSCCWCVQDVRLQDCYAQVTPGLAECCENACWRVLCKCMLDIRCSVLRGWSCAITKSFEFWLRTVEKMGLILSS